MPEICIMPSIPLLASFQQLTELGESSHILQDLSRNQGRGPVESQYSHLKDILETWRLRTPNEWERVSTWSDIMLWRNVIYNIVINAFQSVKDVAPHLHQLGYRDRAWSVNRWAACLSADWFQCTEQDSLYDALPWNCSLLQQASSQACTLHAQHAL